MFFFVAIGAPTRFQLQSNPIRPHWKLYSLLFNSNEGSPAFAPCPCAVHNRPIRDDDGVAAAAAAAALDATEAPLVIVAVGGLMPVGLGSLDDAVEISLFIDRSDGVGDGARASGAPDGVESLIVLFFFFTLFILVDKNSPLDNSTQNH